MSIGRRVVSHMVISPPIDMVSYSLPGDAAIIAQSTQHALRAGTAARYQGHGFEHFLPFLRERGWVPVSEWTGLGIYPHIDKYMDGGVNPLTYSQRVDLLILYVQWLYNNSFNPLTGIQALRYQFVLAKHTTDIFEDGMLSVARFSTHPSQMHNQADRRKSGERNMVSPTMLKHMYERTWPPNIQLSSLSADAVDNAGAVCAGFCMYQFARRVSEFLKTRSDKHWRGPAALVTGSNDEGVPQASIVRDSRGRELDQKLVLDPHAIRAKSVAFAFGSESPRQFYTARQLVAMAGKDPGGFPVEVQMTFYTTKTKNAGKPEFAYVEAQSDKPGTIALVRMLYLWAQFAQYDDDRDMFFSRPSVRAESDGRKRLLDKTLTQVLVSTAVQMKLSTDGIGFSTNSFKVGSMSKIRKDLEEDGFDEDDVQSGVMSHSGHMTKSAAMHYQRPSIQIARPLDSVWTDPVRDASDHQDMVRSVTQKPSVASRLPKKITGSHRLPTITPRQTKVGRLSTRR